MANSALHPSKCYWHSLQPRWPRITADSGDSGLILNRSWWCSRNTLPCVCTERLKLASAGHHCISVQGVSPEIQAQRIEAHHYTSHFFLFRNQQPSTYEVWTLRFHVSYVSSLGLPRHDGSIQKKKGQACTKEKLSPFHESEHALRTAHNLRGKRFYTSDRPWIEAWKKAVSIVWTCFIWGPQNSRTYHPTKGITASWTSVAIFTAKVSLIRLVSV